MSLIPHAPADLVPILTAIDPTGDGQKKLSRVLTDPPRSIAAGDLPIAYITIDFKRPMKYGDWGQHTGTFSYYVKTVVLVDVFQAGLGDPQNHAMLIVWPRAIGQAFKKNHRLNDPTNILHIGPEDTSGDLVDFNFVLKNFSGVDYVAVEVPLFVREVDRSVESGI